MASIILPDGAIAVGIETNGRVYLNSTRTAWLIMNGSDCELHVPAGGAFVTVIEE